MPKPSKNTKTAENETVNEEVQNEHTHEHDPSNETEDDVKNITCQDFSVNRMYFRAIEPNDEAVQLMCYPKYLYDPEMEPTPENLEKHGESMILVTKPIKINKGGIPKHNPKYHTNDPNSMKRAYFYIPKNKDDPNSMELFETLDKIDNYMDEEVNKNKNKNGVLCALNKSKKRIPLKGLKYTRIVTTAKQVDNLSLDDDEDDSNKKKSGNGKFDDSKKDFVPWDRVKVRLGTLYDESLKPDANRDITTQVYVGGKEEAEKIKTVSDVEKYFSWNCVAQFALMFCKVWIKKSDGKDCSISLKCLQIGVTEQSEFKKNSSITKQLNKKLFASTAPSASTTSNKPKESVKETVKETVKEKEVAKKSKSDDQDKSDDDQDKSDKSDDQDKSDSEPESDDDRSKKKGKDLKVKGKSSDSNSSKERESTKKSKK